MLLIIISALLLMLFLYLLFVPIVLFIDTSTKQYFIQIKGIAKANIEADKQEIIKIKLKVFFFNFCFYPLKKTATTKKKKKHKTKKRRRRLSFKTVSKLLKSFKIKQFYVDIDTGDCISNAKLYPIFAFLNYYKGGFYINFEDRNKVLLSIENRPIRIIKSFINI